MGIGKMITNIFSDIDDQLSSKRVFLAICTIVLIISWLADLIFARTVTEFIFEGFLYATFVGILGIGAEKFVRRRVDGQANYKDYYNAWNLTNKNNDKKQNQDDEELS